MHTRQGVASNPQSKSTVPSDPANTPETAPRIRPDAVSNELSPWIVDRLFSPGQNNTWQDGALPFIGKHENEPTSYWVEPPMGEADSDAYMSNSEVFGKRAAAAYFIHVLRHGARDISLASVVEAMPNPPDYACQNFFHYLQRLLWLYGQHVSAVQVANDVEAEIAESQQRYAEDHAENQP